MRMRETWASLISLGSDENRTARLRVGAMGIGARSVYLRPRLPALARRVRAYIHEPEAAVASAASASADAS